MHTPQQVQQLLLDGSIDGIQVFLCQQASRVTLYKDGEAVDEQPWLPNDLRGYSRAINEMDKWLWSEVFVNKKIKDYRCICFRYDGESYCILRQGVSVNLNLTEIFNMKVKGREEISYVNKTNGVRLTIPLTDAMKEKLMNGGE